MMGNIYASKFSGNECWIKTIWYRRCSPAITPGNRLFWLKADAGTFQNINFTNPAVSTNDPVLSWQDQSGNNNHVTLNNTSTSPLNFIPTLTLNALNGLPKIGPTISGRRGNRWNMTTPISLPNTWTAYVVVPTWPGNELTIPFFQHTVSTNAFIGYGNQSSVQAEAIDDLGTQLNWGTATVPLSGPVLFRMRKDVNNTVYFAATGFPELGSPITFPGSFTFNAFTVIRTNGDTVGEGQLWDADTVATGQDSAIMAALTSRWGLTIP